jgi:DNA sulfur modification protein DndE
MAIKQIRLASQAKDQLVRLKSKTGISQWNILCRWAFCISLAEETPPTPVDIPADSNVEMTWHVFGGEYHEVYLALLQERCIVDGIDIQDDAAVNRQFRLHLHRGLGYLATPNRIRSVADLVATATASDTER